MDLKSDVLTLQNQCPKVNPSVSKISLPLQSPRDFSSLQTKSPRQGCIASGFFIPAERIFSAGMHHLRNYTPDFRAPPQSAVLTSIHLNACRAPPHLIKPTVPILKLPTFIPYDLLYYISCMASGIWRNVMFSAKSRYAVTIRFSCFISSWLR